MTLSEFKSWFDPHLEKAIDAQLASYRTVCDDPSIEQYVRHLRDLALHGGKRARPYIAWLSYKSFGGKSHTTIVPVLVGLEIFHLFCLVQDDITDRAFTRHGVTTEHSYVADYLSAESRLGDLRHASDNMAMLAGDLLHSSAHELLLSAELPSKIMQPLMHEFHAMTKQVILGQMLDLDLITRAAVDTDTIETKQGLKTSGYTFVSPLKMGACLADALKDNHEWCEQLGYAVGSIYQLQDDMLDILGLDTNKENKTAGNDLKEGVHTFLTQYIREHGTESQKQTLDTFFRHPFAAKNYPEIISLYKESGALEAARHIVTQKSDQARKIIAAAHFDAAYKQKWLDLITFLEKRA